VDDPIEAAINWWRATGVEVNPPADAENLVALARFIGAPVPDELHRFYQLADGMVDFASDNHEVSFWSIDRLLSENDTRAGVDDRGEYRDIAFADFMIDSWRFFLRLRSNGAVSVYAEEGGPAATSLSDFFTRYLSDPCPYPV
jgi:hypothetical protein